METNNEIPTADEVGRMVLEWMGHQNEVVPAGERDALRRQHDACTGEQCFDDLVKNGTLLAEWNVEIDGVSVGFSLLARGDLWGVLEMVAGRLKRARVIG